MSERTDFDKRFVQLWLQAAKEGRNTEWVAEQLGVPRQYAQSKSETLRRRGVKLPSMKTGRYSISPEHVADLNKIIGEGDGIRP